MWLPSPRVLANAGTHPHPSQPTPISPVADVHGATPLVLADAGTHPHPTQPTPISPVADVHGATPLVLANAGTHPHPTQPTPISPVADVHGATPLVLADAGTHPTQPTPISPVADVHGATPLVLAPPLLSSRMRGPIPTQVNPRPSLPWQTYPRWHEHPSCPRGCGDPSPHPFRHSGESRNPSPDPKTERLHKTSPSVITNTPSATTMKIAPHTSPRRGNPLWLPSPNSYTFHSEQSEAKSKNQSHNIQRRTGWN